MVDVLLRHGPIQLWKLKKKKLKMKISLVNNLIILQPPVISIQEDFMNLSAFTLSFPRSSRQLTNLKKNNTLILPLDNALMIGRRTLKLLEAKKVLRLVINLKDLINPYGYKRPKLILKCLLKEDNLSNSLSTLRLNTNAPMSAKSLDYSFSNVKINLYLQRPVINKSKLSSMKTLASLFPYL